LICIEGISLKVDLVTFDGISRRVRPIFLKVIGLLPNCPWEVVFSLVSPLTLNPNPPSLDIEKTDSKGQFQLLKFAGTRSFWLPSSMQISQALWNEYLSVFWHHPANFHYYLSYGSSVSSGDTVIDCGACEGFFIMQALEAGASRIIAIEPNPVMTKCLEMTFAKEISTNEVVLLPNALGSSLGEISFSFNEADPFSGFVKKDSSSFFVTMTTLDEIFRKLSLRRVDFIKMDIEGFELDATLGACDLLNSFHPKLAITTYHNESDCINLKKILKSFGYKRVRAVGLTSRSSGNKFRPFLIHA